MLSMDTTKIAGSILVALLTAAGIGQFADALTVFEAPQRNVIGTEDAAVEKAEPAEEAEEAGARTIGPLLAAADTDAGARLAKRRCAACHTFDEGGKNKIGPNLWNVVGRDKASLDGYRYSAALKSLEGEWTYEDLASFLERPKAYAKGTKMTFAGLKNVEDRASIIAFLRAMADEPAPLPRE